MWCTACGHAIRWGIPKCVECVGGCVCVHAHMCAHVCGMCGNLHGIYMVHVICVMHVVVDEYLCLGYIFEVWL